MHVCMYYPKGPGAPQRASGKHKDRKGYTHKVDCNFDFPVGQFRFVGCERVETSGSHANVWRLDPTFAIPRARNGGR